MKYYLTCTVFGLSLLLNNGCTPVWERQARATHNNVTERPAVIAAHQALNEEHPLAPPKNLLAAISSLDQLVEFGLQHNPALQARYAAVERQRYAVAGAGVLPSPRVQVAPFGQMAQTATGEVTVMTTLSQQFPAFGALSADVSLAEADLAAAEAAVRERQIMLAANIRQAWWNLYVAQATTAIVKEQQQVLEQLQKSIVQRIEIGAAKQSDALRLAVELDQLKAMLWSWHEREETATAALRFAVSDKTDLPLPHISVKEGPANLYREERLLAVAYEQRSDILANRAQQKKAQAMHVAARARHRPDFGVSVNYNFVDDHNVMGKTKGDDQWWIGFNMSVPLWISAYAAGDHAADFAWQEAVHGERGIFDGIKRDIRTALSSWHSAQEQLHLFSSDMLANAKQAFAAEQALYQTGNSTFVDAIGAWKQILMINMSIERLRRDSGVAEATILQAAGVTTTSQLNQAVQQTAPQQK